jgi:ubiquinone/menaquinone biosynthesis C-methylase UbiE
VKEYIIHNQKEIVRKSYDKLSYNYRSDDTPDNLGSYYEWVEYLRKHIPEHSPVLDIGCGCGLPATKLLSKHFNVTGLDFSEVQIDRARKLVPNARFICSDISKIEFPENSFNAIVSFYAIIHIPLDEHPGLFKQVSKWLSPEGILLVIVGHKAWTGTDDAYLGVEGGKMCWSHEGESAYLKWISESGLDISWKRFIPEDDSGHTLICAKKPSKLTRRR